MKTILNFLFIMCIIFMVSCNRHESNDMAIIHNVETHKTDTVFCSWVDSIDTEFIIIEIIVNVGDFDNKQISIYDEFHGDMPENYKVGSANNAIYYFYYLGIVLKKYES